MRQYALTSICLVIFLTFGCSGNDEPLKKKDFAVDSALVQKKEIFPKYQFSFNPPMNWERLPQEVFDKLKERLKTVYPKERGVVYNSIDLFYNSETKCMLYITSVDFIGVKNDVFEEYDELLRDSFNNYGVEYEKYLKDDFMIMQYIIHENDRMNYKAVFSPVKNSLVQFDYLLPKDVYENELKAVQSSLGALALIE